MKKIFNPTQSAKVMPEDRSVLWRRRISPLAERGAAPVERASPLLGRKARLISLLSSLLFCAIFLFALMNPTPASAQVRKRWELGFTNKTPQLFTYVDPNDNKTNYWYLIYTITNHTDDNIRLVLDICIKTDTNKYYQDTWQPIIEDGMISREEKLGGLPLGLQKVRIKELKAELKYLNTREIREKSEIKPKETITGIAVFKELDKQAKEYEVMVGGLVDMVKLSFTPPPDIQAVYGYEPKILKITYSHEGDEFSKHLQPVTDPVDPEKEVKKREWIIRRYGPIGDKDTLQNLIESLKDDNPLIRWIAWWLLRRMTTKDVHEKPAFTYQPSLTPNENQKAIKRWQEWWARNNEKLVYNQTDNRFEIKANPE
ncbi:MAG: HEAT repeat domain-containing protein [Planctomycetes bacterium]|nr:HEAT repeat domain-containing protein [Planctomycetota bacterium]